MVLEGPGDFGCKIRVWIELLILSLFYTKKITTKLNRQTHVFNELQLFSICSFGKLSDRLSDMTSKKPALTYQRIITSNGGCRREEKRRNHCSLFTKFLSSVTATKSRAINCMYWYTENQRKIGLSQWSKMSWNIQNNSTKQPTLLTVMLSYMPNLKH